MRQSSWLIGKLINTLPLAQALVFYCFFIFSVGISEASDRTILMLESSDSRPFLGNHVTVYEDASKELSVSHLYNLYNSGQFKKPERTSLQFGYRKSAIWLALSLENQSELPITNNLEIRYPPLDYIDVFLLDLSGQITQHIQLGDRHPYNERPVKSRIYLAPLTVKAQSQNVLLVRVTSQSSLSIPMYLSSPDATYQSEHYTQIAMGMFYGIALGLFLYNLFLFLLVKDIIYLQYIFYVLGYTLFMATMDGLLYQFWPNSPDWGSRSIYIFPWVCGVFLSLFCRNVLQTRNEAPICDLILRVYSVVYLLGALSFFFIDITTAAKINAPFIMLHAFVILGITIRRFFQGHRAAAYFIVGMGSFCVGLIMVAGGAMNLHNDYEMAQAFLKGGATLEMIMFSIALAQRINTLRAANELTRKEAALARKEAEARAKYSEKMLQVNQHLEEAIQAKSDFLANMSHEIRTPMNGVLGMVELAQSTELNSQQRHYMDVAYRSGKTLLALINDVLDLSKIESGKLELEKIDFSLEHLLNDLRSLFSVQIEDKHLYFATNLEKGVPLWIKTDRTRVWQILTNLIGNAIKFTPTGGITVSVSQSEANRLTIIVADTGIGIGEDAQKKIFSSFTQADSSTTRKFGGTGLGLTISKQLVELMGGKLSVQSSLGEGSKFIFEMPFEKGMQPSANDNTYEEGGVLIDDCSGLRVLLVEDNQVNQIVATGMFGKLGINPEIANDGVEATNKCRRQEYDLIFMDMQMPNMDGVAATKIILEEATFNKATPIIAMTANAMQGDREICLSAGMKDYIAKPIDIKGLRSMVVKWSAQHRAGERRAKLAP